MYLVSGCGENGRDDFGELDGELGVRIDVNLYRLGVEIARRKIPVLAFASVGRQLDRSAVGAVKGLVDVQHRLHVVIARRHLVERADRITGGRAGDGDRLTGGQSVDSGAKDDLRTRGVVDLHARLCGRIVREQQEYAAVERLGGYARGKTDRNLRRNCGMAVVAATRGQKQSGEMRRHSREYTSGANLSPASCFARPALVIDHRGHRLGFADVLRY